MTLALPARAKLNLDLKVLGRRDDGYHEVRSTLQAIDLHDTLEVEIADPLDALTTLAVTGFGIPQTPANTVLVAHRALEAAVGRPLPARFRLHKRIPPGSGLGGASSDAAAALRGLRELYGLKASLEPIAGQVGVDVPFFLSGGAAEASGRGDLLTQRSGEAAWYAIAWPGIQLSTRAVYAAWDGVGGSPPNELRRAAEKVEPRLREFAASLGPGDWRLTGSGSAFFLRCVSREHAAEKAASLSCWTAVATAVGPWA